MLAIGFLTGIMLAAKRAQRAGENPEHIYNLSIWIMISSLLGARIYYVVTHFSEFSAGPGLPLISSIFVVMKNMFWPVGNNGQIGINGLVLLGGLITATFAAAYYLHIHKLNVLKYMDLMGPSLGLGEFFTRIGCFLNGCCFGSPTSCAFGIHFPPDSPADYYYPGLAIHPTQLYQSFAGLLICVILIYMERYKKFDGFTAFSYFILYSIARFVTDFFRYYEPNLKFMGLSHNQWLSIAIFAVAFTAFIMFWIKKVKNVSDNAKTTY